MTDEQRLARYACDCSALPGRPHSPSCLTELNDETTDPVIPPEAVVAAAKAQHGLTEADWSAMSDSARAYALAGVERSLRAALPHLRPLFEVATQVGLELGRKEAAEEIAAELEEMVPLWMANTASMGDGIDQRRAAAIAREVATRTADARTDPSGHTDLPPTRAGTKRYPEEGDEWCCGTCQRIAWEANPMSREEQSTGETP